MTVVDRSEYGSRLRRPTATAGWRSWFVTVDHKRIGVLYGATAFAFFIIGGVEALLLRAQLAQPNGTILGADTYNQLFTMHGLTMIFLVVMPLATALFNYLLPLQIGARDVAFPRLNAFTYWTFLCGGLFLYSSVLFGGLPDGGWFGYAPLSILGGDPSGFTLARAAANRMLFYSLGLQILGVASIAGSVNLIVTALNLRASGMTFMRMPLFAWMTLITSMLTLFAMPIIGVALWMLLFDLRFGSTFFQPAAGGDPMLWQHLFWLFGHPEVYIMALPAFGAVSEVMPTFSRKPLFGYPVMVFSGVAIAFIGFGVWAHHMFTTGMGPVANTAFAVSSMIIAVPTGVKIFNWIGTMWGGQLRFRVPMLFAIAFVAQFVVGGLSGVLQTVAPHNYQQHDTYFVVAHFHYVLLGGSLFGLFAGIYYWWPKITGRLLDERAGKVHFWVMAVGFNLTFFPMHWIGLQGMPRRVFTYPTGMGWDGWNLAATIGAFAIAVSVAIFLGNVAWTARHGSHAGPDPWDGRTLEWITSSPPPAHNFDALPIVSARDELWHRKHVMIDRSVQRSESATTSAQQSPRRPHPRADDRAVVEAAPRLPSPSYYPLIAATGLPITAYGVLLPGALQVALLAAGAAILLFGLFGWAFEPSHAPTRRTRLGVERGRSGPTAC
jgi:cytochrome c oxidase subunit I